MSPTTPPAQPPPFNGAPDADALYKAMKGLGTDDKVLSNIIATRTRDQLLEVRKTFEQKYGKTLVQWIKGETSGHYEVLLISMIEPKADYDAILVKEAVRGLGTDDDQVIEVLCTRTNAELKAMKDAYRRLYSVEVEKDVGGDTSGDYRELLLNILRADRPESATVDVEAAKRDAQTLYQAGEGKLGTDERTFIEILTKRTYPHLHTMAQQYANITGHSLEVGISKEMSGNFKKALIVLVTPRDEYFATQMHEAMVGGGTNDKKLIRILSYISNSKDTAKAVNTFYTHRYRNTLPNDVGGDTSGWYKKTAVAILQNRLAL
jgi:annexin A7/11